MKTFYAAACAVLLGLSGASVQAGSVDQDTVFDERDNIPLNTFGNCVRTKWSADGDACAPAPEPAPVVVAPPPPPPAPKIAREARTVYFDFNKSTLNAEGVTKLDTLIAHIARSKGITGAGIAGFADRIGSNDYNLELSKKRAKTVYNYLSQRVQIPTQILDIRAAGENAPVTDCATSLRRSEQVACLQKDRRVEVVFQYQQ